MDVTAQRVIAAAPRRVAAVMFDPAKDPMWIGGAKRVEPVSGGVLTKGDRVRRHGGFLGRKFSWVTEVTAFEPERRVEMRFVEGPMKGGVTYQIEPIDRGALVSIRNHGGAGFAFPGLAWFLKRSVAKDLDRLAALVERRS